MNRKSILVVSSIILALVVAVIWSDLSFKPVSENNVFALQSPASVQTLKNSTGESIAASLLDNEAGISAYFQTSPIALSSVRGLFRSIEIETSNYILGTFTLPNNSEDYDVHVYIHQSGWVLIYYLKQDPAVMIFDWQTYTGTMNPTRFQVAANLITYTLNRSNPTLTYYDFRYPNATNLLIAIEDVRVMNETGEFTVPSTSFHYFETSWFFGGKLNSHPDVWSADAEFKVDAVQIKHFNCNDCTQYYFGFFDGIVYPPSASHVAQVRNYNATWGTPLLMGAIAIVYGP